MCIYIVRLKIGKSYGDGTRKVTDSVSDELKEGSVQALGGSDRVNFQRVSNVS